MSLKFLLATIAIAAMSSVLGWHDAAWALDVCSLAIFLGVGCGLAPALFLTRLQSTCGAPSIDRGARDAIVLLTAGTTRVPLIEHLEPGMFAYGRILKAGELYRACKQDGGECKIIVSGGDTRGYGMAEAQIYGRCLHRLGVDVGDVTLEERSMNAWQNAQFAADVLRRRRADRVLLVSSGFHLQRSCLYFRHFGVDAIPVRADYLAARMSPWPVAYNFAVADVAIHEYIGMARYYVYNMLGWNIAAVPRG
jgi:uncharacterized SAM-binding protein YcdF (DUF218 family)